MLAAEWTATAIASACDIPQYIVRDIVDEARQGKRRQFGAGLSAKIVNHGKPTAGKVSALGARRRTQALGRLGHTTDVIAAAAGRGATTIVKIQNGFTCTVTPAIEEDIHRAWVALSNKPGVSAVAAKRAAKLGWAPPLAWDDIDDPRERPKGVAGVAA
jgi:hypothetical protein